MNRFEAQHVLGLDENATEQDVRLAYYGLEKAVRKGDYSSSPQVERLVVGNLAHAKEARDFLLKEFEKGKPLMSRAQRKQATKLSITKTTETTARLGGFERLRGVLVGYLSNEQHKRNMSILLLLGCVVVGFIFLRYLRIMMARIAAFVVLAAVAIAGSTILTSSLMQIKKSKVFVLEADEHIDGLRKALGLDHEDDDADEESEDEPDEDDDEEGDELMEEPDEEDGDDER